MDKSFGKCRLSLTRTDAGNGNDLSGPDSSGFDLDVDFDIPFNKVLGLFGESGAGKTTVLRCIAGLETKATGLIEIDNEVWLSNKGLQFKAHERSIGYVFQDSRLFPHLSVDKNLDYGYRRCIDKKQTILIQREEVIELLNLAKLLPRYPHQLSGGENQLVAIGRALLSQPKLLLFDEPLASLDDKRRQEILPFLEKIHSQINVPMIYVSHRVEEIQRLCDQLLVLEHGKVTYCGNVGQALTSKQAPFAKQHNASVLLKVKPLSYDQEQSISIAQLGGQTLYVPAQLQNNDSIALRVLATDVSLSLVRPEQTTILNILEGTIGEVVSESSYHVTLLIKVQNQALLARISKKSYSVLSLQPKMKVFAQIKAVSIHTF